MAERNNRNSSGAIRDNKRFSLAEEVRIYGGVFRRYWPLQISLGVLLTSLYLFPFQGTIFTNLTAGMAVNGHPLSAVFLSGVVAGLAILACLVWLRFRLIPWLPLAALPCIAASIALAFLADTYWGPLFFLAGIFNGAMILTWAIFYIKYVPADRKVRVFTTGTLLSGVIPLIIGLFMGSAANTSLIVVYSLILIVFPLTLMPVYYRKQKNDSLDFNNEPEPEKGLLTLHTLWPYLVIVFLTSGVSGLAQVIMDYKIPVETTSWMSPGWIPFFLLLVVAGTIGDRKGRRRIAYIGVVMTGVGFMTAGFLQEPLRMFAIQFLALGGYAFLDTFCWVIPADLAKGPKSLPVYSGFMIVYVAANIAGVLIGKWIITFSGDIELITISLSGLLVIISMLFVTRIKEPSTIFQPKAETFPVIDVERSLEEINLTNREKEIARLLLAGTATTEIQTKTCIADTTLKSHLRNIYRKAGVRNRLELTLAILKTDKVTEKENDPLMEM